MKPSSKDERRRGIYWLVAGVIFLALMLGAWWLVEATNEEGTHDAQLLPFFCSSRCSSAPTTLFERGSTTPEP